MNFTKHENSRIGDCYYSAVHKSGLTLYVYPMKGYASSFAVFSTKYGSVDSRFKLSGEEEFTSVPDGIAHFLEHKLFENEDCDAFERYAKTGADANAFTSFDRTSYLFTCSENFEQSFEILLDFVQSPYFTPETVAKEQGIIAQEIKMYDDLPTWRVFFNLFGAMYHNHPIQKDIAGSVESINQITSDLLYKCYNTFYNLSNMVISVSGNVTPEAVGEIAERMLKNPPPISIERSYPDEPESVKTAYTEQHFDVATPLFQLGFKEKPTEQSDRDSVLSSIFTTAFAGSQSRLYRRLMDKNLINRSFGGETMQLDSMKCTVFEGESSDPVAVREEFFKEIEYRKQAGFTPEEFEEARRSVYGSLVSNLEVVYNAGETLASMHVNGLSLYGQIEEAANARPEDINGMTGEKLDAEKCSLSVVSAQA
ncbi:MAG: insulinase family protein [Oscillospiraceae bacterium]|jgi:predicted Zn-dependent peptidase|nr:insulinase family protein [Oscillospiraceae bacterium]